MKTFWEIKKIIDEKESLIWVHSWGVYRPLTTFLKDPSQWIKKAEGIIICKSGEEIRGYWHAEEKVRCVSDYEAINSSIEKNKIKQFKSRLNMNFKVETNSN